MPKTLRGNIDGNLLFVQIDDSRLANALRQELTYQRIKPLMTRAQRRNAGGAPVAISTIRVFEETRPGEFYIPAGMQHRIEKLAASCSYTVEWADVTPAAYRKEDKFRLDHSVLREFTLRPSQERVLEEIVKQPRGLIIWPTGAGKSFLIKLLCLGLTRANILITACAQTVLEDRYRDLVRHLPQVALYHGSRKMPLRRITCCSAGCLSHLNPGMWDAVFVDEYYEFGTDLRMAALSRFRYSRMYGFGANYRDRIDKADFELEAIFGLPISITDYQEHVADHTVCPIVVRWRVVPFDRDYGDQFGVELLRHAVWRNMVRNRIIAEDARRYPDKQVLICVDTIEHALRLHQLLPEFSVCYSPGQMSPGRIRQFKRMGIWPDTLVPLTPPAANEMKLAFESAILKKVIATSVWNRGVNFRHLEVLIRADAGGSPIDSTQIPGRLSRIADGKECGILHDYIDGMEWRSVAGSVGAKRLYRRSESRYRDYSRHGWVQEIKERVVFPVSKAKGALL